MTYGLISPIICLFFVFLKFVSSFLEGTELIHIFYIVPYSEIKKYLKKRKMGVTGHDVKPRWELDYDLLENEGLFGEYLEMGT